MMRFRACAETGKGKLRLPLFFGHFGDSVRLETVGR